MVHHSHILPRPQVHCTKDISSYQAPNAMKKPGHNLPCRRGAHWGSLPLTPANPWLGEDDGDDQELHDLANRMLTYTRERHL